MDAERRLLFTQLKTLVWTHPVGSGLKALGSGGPRVSRGLLQGARGLML